jgi:hypothetical protein
VAGSLDKQRAAAKQSREVRHASEDADLHISRGGTGDAHIDHLADLGAMEPGSAAFNSMHLVGSAAPEPIIEQMGPLGSEGFGIIRRVDGVTGVEIDTPRIYLPGGDA